MKIEGLSDPAGRVATSRRDFARNAVASVAIVLLPAKPVAAGESERISAPDSPAEDSSALDSKLRPKSLSVADWEEVQARYRNLLRIYGQRISPAEKDRVFSILTVNQHMLASIRSFQLQNSDASACTLRVYEANERSSTPENN